MTFDEFLAAIEHHFVAMFTGELEYFTIIGSIISAIKESLEG